MSQENLVLYRKHRPKSFEEVIGQDHVVAALQNSLKSGKVAHAYLFSGPRGVGKTTLARLIAKSLNCASAQKPCNSCDSCRAFNGGRSLNLIEIDAASTRGIDEIRELRDSVRFAPSEGKYKIYVIDEAHQLTKDAFNALLKTLEEPPAHAIFILATTEFEKVPSTIVSRTQHYDFHRPVLKQICLRLQQISKKEGVKLEDDGAHLIALASEGSMRDAESILGQILAAEGKTVGRQEVENVLGLPPREAAKKMFGLIAKKETAPALALIQELNEAGYDLSYFSKLLMRYFRNALFLKTDPSLKKFAEEEMLPDELEILEGNLPAFETQDLSRGVSVIFDNLQRFRKTPLPQLPLELTIIDLMNLKQEDEKL